MASPGQNPLAAFEFASARGVFDSFLEGQVLPTPSGIQNLSSAAIIQQSVAQGIPLAVINASNLSVLEGFNLPADAKARITANVQAGLTEIVPTQALSVNGTPTTAWYDLNTTTGEMIAESQDGGHQGLEEFAFALAISLALHGLLGVYLAYEVQIASPQEPKPNDQLPKIAAARRSESPDWWLSLSLCSGYRSLFCLVTLRPSLASWLSRIHRCHPRRVI